MPRYRLIEVKEFQLKEAGRSQQTGAHHVQGSRVHSQPLAHLTPTLKGPCEVGGHELPEPQMHYESESTSSS